MICQLASGTALDFCDGRKLENVKMAYPDIGPAGYRHFFQGIKLSPKLITSTEKAAHYVAHLFVQHWKPILSVPY